MNRRDFLERSSIAAIAVIKRKYNYMYQHMILPAVDLVKQQQHEEATILYKTFVQALKERYC
jgi:hypothetical protein